LISDDMFGFPKSSRLLKKNEFKSNLDRGNKSVCHHLVVFALENQCGKMRLGLIVSKKVGDAVTRNKAKRRLRESFRTLEPDLRKLPIDLVVIARHTAAKADYSDINRSFRLCINRLLSKFSQRQNDIGTTIHD
jgi:ribonuclease P protein component